jgi:hypothetical protein
VVIAVHDLAAEKVGHLLGIECVLVAAFQCAVFLIFRVCVCVCALCAPYRRTGALNRTALAHWRRTTAHWRTGGV